MNCVLCVATMIVDGTFQKMEESHDLHSCIFVLGSISAMSVASMLAEGLSTKAERSLRYQQLGNSFLTNLTRDAKVNEF